MKINKNIVMFAISFFISYVAFSIPNGYMQVFLNHIGYSNIQVGTIMSFAAFVAIITQLIVGYICDKFKTDKHVYNIGFLILLISVYFMFEITNKEFYMHLLFVSLVIGLSRTLMILHETWSLEVDENCKTNFGAIRLFGSLGWVLGSLIGGYIIDLYGFSMLNEIFLFLGILNIIFSMFISDAVKVSKENNESINLSDIKNLISSKKYILIVLTFLMINIISSSDTYMITEKLIHLNADGKAIGLKSSIQAFVELPLFLLGAYLVKKYGGYKLMIFGIIMYGIKLIMFSLTTNINQILIVSSMQAITYPLIMIASKILIDDVTPNTIRATGQTIAGAVYIGMSMLLSPILSSFMIHKLGTNISLILVGIFAFVPLYLAYLYKKA